LHKENYFGAKIIKTFKIIIGFLSFLLSLRIISGKVKPNIIKNVIIQYGKDF